MSERGAKNNEFFASLDKRAVNHRWQDDGDNTNDEKISNRCRVMTYLLRYYRGGVGDEYYTQNMHKKVARNIPTINDDP